MLYAELPSLRLRVLEVTRDETKPATQGGQDALTRARRRIHAEGEWIEERSLEGQTDVSGRYDWSRLREARRTHSEDDRRHGEDAPAAAQHSLIGQLVGDADARLHVVFVRVPEAAIVVIGEEQTAFDIEVGGRDFGDRFGRVCRLGRSLDGIGDGAIEADDIAVEPFGRRVLQFPAHAEVERQLARRPPIIVEEEALI